MKKEEKEKAIKFRKSGMPITKISEELNISKSTACVWLKDYPLTRDERYSRKGNSPSIETRAKISKGIERYYKNNPKKKKSSEYKRKWRAEYNLKRYHQKKAWAIKHLGGKCSICNSIKNLTIDHKDPFQKSFDIGKYITYSKESVLKELSKCQALCYGCHKIKNKTDGSRYKNKLNGEDVHLSKLRECDVRGIKDMLRNNESGVRIAKQFNVQPGTIYHIKSGKTWKHIK